MADNIVSGLFGIDPAQIQQQRMAQDLKEGYMLANLSPMERATAGIYAGSKQFGRAAQGLLGMEDPQLQEAAMAKKISENFDVNSVAGLRGLAAELQRAGSLRYSQLAAQQANDLEKQGLGLQKTKADIELQERKVSQDEKLREALSKLPEDATDAQYLQVFRQFGSPDQQAKAIEASIARRERLKAKGDGVGGLGKLNTAEKAVDTKFGKEYADFFAGGGINSLEKNVEELNRAIDIIEKSKEGDTSGKVIGLADKTGQLTFVSPLAADVKDIIGGVAQSNLRQILGGQFAAKEGEALLQRQYDTGQTKENNLKRLRALYKQASDTIKDKKAAAEYYEQFGTLKGFKGTGSSDKKEETPPAGNKKTRTLKSGLVVTIED